MVDGRTRHAREVLADVHERYGLDVLEPHVPKSIRFAEAPAMGRSILEHAPARRARPPTGRWPRSCDDRMSAPRDPGKRALFSVSDRIRGRAAAREPRRPGGEGRAVLGGDTSTPAPWCSTARSCGGRTLRRLPRVRAPPPPRVALAPVARAPRRLMRLPACGSRTWVAARWLE